MNTKKLFLFLPLFLLLALMTGSVGCSKNDTAVNEQYTLHDSVDYYGKLVPFIPASSSNIPEWLNKKIEEGNKLALYRVCRGMRKSETFYHLNYLIDSNHAGHIYDEKGVPITLDVEFKEFLTQGYDVKCIYCKSPVY